MVPTCSRAFPWSATTSSSMKAWERAAKTGRAFPSGLGSRPSRWTGSPLAERRRRNPRMATDLKQLAQDVIKRAMAGGAYAAECVVREGDEFSSVVRLGHVETLKESGGRSMGLRIFFNANGGNGNKDGQRAPSTYTSHFS